MKRLLSNLLNSAAIFWRDESGTLTTTFANDLALLIMEATAIANVADNAASAPFTNTEISLHTASPGVGGNQTTNEVTYTSYARVAVARTGVGWDTTGGVSAPAANIDFPAGTGGSGTATHMGIGTTHTGAGKLLMFGTVTPNIVCGNGVTPRLTTATAVTWT